MYQRRIGNHRHHQFVVVAVELTQMVWSMADLEYRHEPHEHLLTTTHWPSYDILKTCRRHCSPTPFVRINAVASDDLILAPVTSNVE